MFVAAATLVCLVHAVLSAPQNTATAPPSITVSTAVPSPSGASNSPLPSQQPLPPKQAWCPSSIFCAGPLLQTVNVANLYPDPKTFVDKPTSKASQQVLSDFNTTVSSSTVTTQAIVDFVDSDFKGEGLELEPQSLPNFNPNPKFLNNISDPLLKSFSQTVHSYWTQLIRGTNASTLCDGKACESSLIPLNHTFVVPGGRFREQYYWDSFWIVEGLLQSEMYDIVNATLQNFMDELETIGFIPNGGRIYYLNRSQPPLFIHMLSAYVKATNDRAILTRALPLAETELKWWQDRRSINITSPTTSKTHIVYRYAVNNTAPRPESYLTDYNTANDPALKPALNESQKGDLYAELASGAETGWDYTARWLKDPSVGLSTLNVRGIVPICLNSILYKARTLMVELYTIAPNPSANEEQRRHMAAADALRSAILDLLWDPSKLAFYDFNIAAKARNGIFTVATFYPLWSGIIPNELLSGQDKAFGFFSTLNMVMHRYNGTYPTTLVDTHLQWDAPNAWPPHQYIVLQALRALPKNVTTNTIPPPPSGQSTYSLVPAGQLGLTEAQLPGQILRGEQNATQTGAGADINTVSHDGVVTVFNGGSGTQGEGWAAALQRELANRYMASAFCSWHATGGQIPGILPRLSDAELNVTQSVNNTGNMFEKFSNLDIDSAGRGGEYTVQAGFGWTNGVALWISSNYGKVLATPTCPSLLEAGGGGGGGGGGGQGQKGSNAALGLRSVPVAALALAFFVVVILTLLM